MIDVETFHLGPDEYEKGDKKEPTCPLFGSHWGDVNRRTYLCQRHTGIMNGTVSSLVESW